MICLLVNSAIISLFDHLRNNFLSQMTCDMQKMDIFQRKWRIWGGNFAFKHFGLYLDPFTLSEVTLVSAVTGILKVSPFLRITLNFLFLSIHCDNLLTNPAYNTLVTVHTVAFMGCHSDYTGLHGKLGLMTANPKASLLRDSVQLASLKGKYSDP